jgi:hypothetical protein
VLRKELVDSFPTGNPNISGAPSLFSSTKFALAEQRSDGLSTCSERIRCLSDCEVVPHAAKAIAPLSETQQQSPLSVHPRVCARHILPANSHKIHDERRSLIEDRSASLQWNTPRWIVQ